MQRVYAHSYMALGEQAQEIRQIYQFAEHEIGPKEIQAEELQQIKEGISAILTHCKNLDLATSPQLLQRRFFDLPRTEREFDLLIEAVYSELKTRMFVYIRPHRAKFFENHDVLGVQATLAFPSCRNELWDASNSVAAGLWTAAVFHSMRAAEIGIRMLAADLGVSFPDKTLEQAEWAQLLDQADSKIKGISQRPKSDERDKDRHFYSTAAAEFRYFKDGWRVRVAHARADYTEEQAIKIFEHTRDFFETLVGRLKE